MSSIVQDVGQQYAGKAQNLSTIQVQIDYVVDDEEIVWTWVCCLALSVSIEIPGAPFQMNEQVAYPFALHTTSGRYLLCSHPFYFHITVLMVYIP